MPRGQKKPKKQALDIDAHDRELFVTSMGQAEHYRKQANSYAKLGFPPGTAIRWMHGDHWQQGRVVEVFDYGVYVLNVMTDKVLRWDFDKLFYNWKNYNV